MDRTDIFNKLKNIYTILLDEFSFQHWWPGQSRLEIVVGALLTQNTNWKNVEKAIANLINAKSMDLNTLITMKTQDLELLIRPSGFYRQKSKRLQSLLRFLMNTYDWDGIKKIDTDPELFRKNLLNCKGIGPETADSILLYAFDYHYFVVDAYTKRILSRAGLIDSADYESIRSLLEQIVITRFNNELSIFKDFHAQIVLLAKLYCKKNPDCTHCPLALTATCNWSKNKI